MTPERARLEEARQLQVPWRKWGPYLSERQWGTVREAGGDVRSEPAGEPAQRGLDVRPLE